MNRVSHVRTTRRHGLAPARTLCDAVNTELWSTEREPRARPHEPADDRDVVKLAAHSVTAISEKRTVREG